MAVYFYGENAEKKVMHKVVDSRFEGNWATDTTGGFSINLRVLEDSVFLSQSNFNGERGFKMVISKDTLWLSNQDLEKEFKWRFRFSDDIHLLLMSDEDSLLLKKY